MCTILVEWLNNIDKDIFPRCVMEWGRLHKNVCAQSNYKL